MRRRRHERRARRARGRRSVAGSASVFVDAVEEALYYAEGDEAADVDVC